MHKQEGAQRLSITGTCVLHGAALKTCGWGGGCEPTSWAPWEETHTHGNDSSKRRATWTPCIPRSVPSTPCPSREGTRCQGSQAQPRLKWLLSTGTQSASQTRPSAGQTQVFGPKDAGMGRRAVCPVPGGRVRHARRLRSAGAFTRGCLPGSGLQSAEGQSPNISSEIDMPGLESPALSRRRPLALVAYLSKLQPPCR